MEVIKQQEQAQNLIYTHVFVWYGIQFKERSELNDRSEVRFEYLSQNWMAQI